MQHLELDAAYLHLQCELLAGGYTTALPPQQGGG